MEVERLSGVLVSGDLTWRASEEEFSLVLDFLRGIQSWSKLNDYQLLLCPGNHDVRFSDDPGELDREVTVAAPVARAAYEHLYQDLYNLAPNEFMSLGRRILLSRTFSVEVASINSSLLEQVPGAFQGHGFVGDQQLDSVATEFGWREGDEGPRPLRVVMLHHHVVPVTYRDIPEHGRSYSVALDAGALTRWAARYRVDLILHGHMHQPSAARLDVPVVTTGELRTWHTLHVIAMGSTGVAQADLGDIQKNTYGLIRFGEEGVSVADFTYHAFARPEIERLQESRLAAVEDLIEAELACGRYHELIGELEGLVKEHPLRERLRAQLMLSLYRSGRQADALSVYQKTRELLGEELGIDPGPALRKLEKAILDQDPSLDPPPRPESAPPSLVPRTSPPEPLLRTISNTNLPKSASSFVGREREVSEVASLLRSGNRLVTLTGPGGTGKTRLAIEAAAELVPEHRNGVFWVGLAPIRDPALVSETIGRTLGAKDGVAAHIAERHMLLVLDNFEQVIEAACDLPVLLETCPNLRLLVTSRELLRVRGEVGYPVPPLADPEAVDLFCRRARLQADEAVAELCRRLDNLPLALELAAARTSVLSPGQILERLSHRLDLFKGGRDAEARQQTPRATIEWSHDLLTPEEQRLFARLSVFRGGCTLETAVQVTETDLDTLQALVDKSLLSHWEDRFWMLETIREFAAERLVDSGESDELRRRHVEQFMALAEEAQPSLYGSHPEEWLERLDREHDNLRAALDRLEASREAQLALQLAGATARFWYVRDHVVEGRRRVEGALRADESPTPARARALNAAAILASNGGDQPTARLMAEEALELHRQLGDAWGAAYSEYALGFVGSDEGDFAGAQPLFEESLQAFRELGDEHHSLLATRALAWTYEALGQRQRAQSLLEDVLHRARAQSNQFLMALSLVELATYAGEEGRIQGALPMLKESLRIFRDTSDRGGIALALGRVAGVLAAQGRSETATRLLSRGDALLEEIGMGAVPRVFAGQAETLISIRAQIDDGAFAEAWEEGRKLDIDEAVALALDSLV